MVAQEFDGSTSSYINGDVVAQLGAQLGGFQKIKVNVLNGQTDIFETAPANLTLESLDGRVKISFTANTTEMVTGKLKAVNWNLHKHKWNHLENIQFPVISTDKALVDVLIGLDYSDLHASIKEVIGKVGEPVARLTPLGWTCVGSSDIKIVKAPGRSYFIRASSIDVETNNAMKKFWSIDNEGLPDEEAQMSVNEKSALKMVEDSLKYKNGRYEVGIPWKNGTKCIKNNRHMAMKRLYCTERKLAKDPDAAKDYNNIIKDYLVKGYIHKVPDENIQQENVWYLPHFAVFRPDKATTKTRIVFDGSAKSNGKSLNEEIHQGPNLQKELFAVLLRFRRHPVAVVSDVSEMYLQVKVKREDQQFLRFLWRDMDISRTPDCFEFDSLIFGLNSSPFEAQFVVKHHAEKNSKQLPLAAEAVLKSTYMDDTMDSVKDNQSGIQLYKELCNLWKGCGMHARKWLSNSKQVLKQIPEVDRAQQLNIHDDKLPSTKALGMLWVADEDVLSFNKINTDVGTSFTKRKFLKVLATVFDPLGFLAPFVIQGKIIMQITWEKGVDWDQVVDPELNDMMKNWVQDLKNIDKIKISRCVGLDQSENEDEMQLHCFCDASEEAYCAAVYIAIKYSSGRKSSRLVAAKTKVAPLDATSVPRLELMGAVVAVKLATSVGRAFSFSSNMIYYWTDNQNVLCWTRGRSKRYKAFIGNRVSKIQKNSDPACWRYVPSKENPADIATHGKSIDDLRKNTLWWYGPEFLIDQNKWPEAVVFVSSQLELRNNHSTYLQIKEQDNMERLNPTRYSSWKKLTRILAWINRFYQNCKQNDRTHRKIGELQPHEVINAEFHFIKKAQQEEFNEEYDVVMKQKCVSVKSSLSCLMPFMDEDGIIRANTRIREADYIPYNVKHPIILPRHHQVSKLIVRQQHLDNNHYGGTIIFYHNYHQNIGSYQQEKL